MYQGIDFSELIKKNLPDVGQAVDREADNIGISVGEVLLKHVGAQENNFCFVMEGH